MKADSRTLQPPATNGAHDARPITLSCENVWKIFGPRGREFLKLRNGSASASELSAANLIGAVRNATLSVRQGEIFIIMGLSGSGKSTLLRCLSRLIEPTAGSVMFEGRNMLAATESELIELRRHKMGMVFQNFALLPHRTVLDNVAFPLQVRGTSRQERESRAREVI